MSEENATEPINPYAPPQEEAPELRPDVDPPTIWNPQAAVFWCLLFPVPWGAVLHALNWRELGEPEEERKQWTWAVAISILLVILLVVPYNVNFAGLAILLVWYFGGAKKQVDHVKKKYGNVYHRKPWAWPIVCGVASLGVAFGVVWMSLSFFDESF